jgi:hypothetical protein
MLFFQLVLLAGYGYAHWLNGRRRYLQAGVHTVLLAVSCLTLPILPRAAWKPVGGENPLWLLLGLLAVTVGIPYFLLSTTSPLIQAWYSRSHAGATPYRLFALSNLASMLALLSYPPLVEPNLTTRSQAQIWSAAYVVFALVCAAIAWRTARWSGKKEAARAADAGEVEDAGPPAWSTRVLWACLAACASTLLLAITTFLTQDVAAIPFLWIVPLAVYLLSFIICFESPRFYWRPVYLRLLVLALAVASYRIWNTRHDWPITWVIAVMTGALFVFCMVCHGELASLKPHPRYLTGYYLMVSLGGAAGGLFVGLVAPAVFHAYYELPVGLGLCAALAVIVLLRGGRLPDARWKAAAVGLLTAYLVFLGFLMQKTVRPYRLVVRNFYGRLAVADEIDPTDADLNVRRFVHGVINHGEQSLREKYRRQPITYFCPRTGIGAAMQSGAPGVPRRIGILGLGCGTLAAYGRPGDVIRIYEINPLVVEIAQRDFTYLKDTPARTEVVLGDGRLSLEREPVQQFDVLVMDAFSGDSVPVHLVTQEAFRTYFRHLKTGGILAVNITNHYLNLAPIVERAAHDFGKAALLYDFDPEEDDFLCFGCTWTLVLDPPQIERLPAGQRGKPIAPSPGFRAWTDDFSNMLKILK